MKILSMTATFGKLENATLTMGDGINLVTAPNEWGKSTWCAFLLAMFYGIDTRERSTADHLADKEKYMPWSGRPMEGRIRLEFEGKDITIERRTRGRTPMGDFRAYETRTGLAVPELTAANCGQRLLGVERSVFQRSGFIRFSDLPVEGDQTLRSRLSALVTTGDESGQAELLSRKLRELKNRCRYNRTGLIPECQTQIHALRDQIREQEALLTQLAQQEAQISQLEQELEKLENHRNNLAYQEAQTDTFRVEQARSSAQTALRLSQVLEKNCAGYPSLEDLERKLQQGEALLEDLDKSDDTPPPPVWPIAVLLVLAAVMALMVWPAPDLAWLWAATGVAFAVGAGVLFLRRRNACRQLDAELEQLDQRRHDLEQAMELWHKQARDLYELENARTNARLTREHLEAVTAMARKITRPEAPDELDLSREETMARISVQNQELRRAHTLLAQTTGKLESLPDPETLILRLEQQTRRLEELERIWQALDYAQKALEAALQELQRRFAPRIARRAGEFLSRLTRGKYDRITIGEFMEIQAAQTTETTLRPALWRSDGTGDQMYLALRLAVWEVLAPDAPLVLDDALVRFDQPRLEAALDLLRELAKDRQILLLTCHDREKQYLQSKQ